MNASRIMSSPPIVVHPGTPIGAALRLLVDARVSCLPVVDANHRLVGSVTESELLRARMLRQTVRPEGATRPLRRVPEFVSDVLHGEVPWVDEHDDLGICLQLMLRHEGRSLPVTQNGRVIGMLSRRDLLKTLPQSRTGHPAPPETLLNNDELPRRYTETLAS